ncbi:MAG: cold shock domain-containing protein [Candidatus Krumholzibacteriota bacterium]|nr:cold shock domain-containing protein [Candidatus Krumholzibacteriota bacterium]
MAETGKIKWFNENKGYGFIMQESDGKDIFVHYSDIDGDGFRTLSEGESVEYELIEGPKGYHAKNVKKV